MKTEIKTITPQQAAKWLEVNNTNNRKLSERTVNKYANDMISGRWALTHQGIAFDDKGNLIDGQHRLMAIVRANRNIEMMVTEGVPRITKVAGKNINTFFMVDGVLPRSTAALLQMEGHKNANRVAALARQIAQICVQNEGFISVSATTAEQIIKACGGSINVVADAISSSEGGIVKLRCSLAAPIAFWHTVNPDKALEFLHEVQSVSGQRGSATRALAKWSSTHPTTGGKFTMCAGFVAASAIFHYCKGNTVEKLYGGDEHMKWLLSLNAPLNQRVVSMFKI